MADGSLSQFKATLPRKQARKDKAKGKFERKRKAMKNPNANTDFNFPKLSNKELEELKREIRSRANSNWRKELIFFGLLVVILCCLSIFLNS